MSAESAGRKLCYKIGEACRVLDIQPYVLRYWETEFQVLAPGKSRSGQRVYTEKELAVIRRIKELLYREGYTIAGAKKKLETEMSAGVFGDVLEPAAAPAMALPPELPRAKREAERGERGERAPRGSAARGRGAAPLSSDTQRVLDSPPDERIETLARSLRELRGEARDLLALLGSKTPRS